MAIDPVPLAERSRLGAKLAEGRFITTVEIVPPKGVDPGPMFEQVRQLKAAGVDAVNVPDGPRAQSRMGALLSALMIEREVGLEAVVHYACRDRNLLGMLSDLLGAAAAGIRNLLIITGDPPKMGPYPEATAVFDIDSIGLTNLVSRLNRGLDPGGNPIGQPTRFVIGVGVNPAAPDLERELKRFAWKVEAGAEYAITQPVFDLEQLERFLRRVGGIPHSDRRRHLAAGLAAERRVPGQRGARRVRCRMPSLERMRQRERRRQGGGIGRGRAHLARDARRRGRRVQGVQVSAPLGRVPVALEVLEAAPIEPVASPGYTPPPDVRCRPSPEPSPPCRTSAAAAPALTTLSEEESMFRDAVREFAETEVRPHVHGDGRGGAVPRRT